LFIKKRLTISLKKKRRRRVELHAVQEYFNGEKIVVCEKKKIVGFLKIREGVRIAISIILI
jgi:hypothetical protein